jgi:tetratricopeptide (TPR) repeat protein
MIAALTLALFCGSMQPGQPGQPMQPAQPGLLSGGEISLFDRIIVDRLSFHFAAPKSQAPSKPSSAKSKLADVKSKFEELHQKDDRAGCLALWKEHPEYVLRAIDADLEGSMRVYESSNEPDMAKIQALHKRALWGAEIAVEATGHPIILDYASSFVGWNKDQRSLFRAGQAVYKKAVDAAQKGDHKTALEAGRECVDRASALGDWWGAAMGYEASGDALQSTSDFDNALVAFSRARILNHDLGLVSSEYSNLRSMIDVCNVLDRWQRGLAAVDEALDMARKADNKDGLIELLQRRASFQEKLGDKTAAEASRAEAKSLR